MNLTEKAYSETLVDNFNCTVEMNEGERLHCITTGKFTTLLLFVLGMLMIYGSIVIIGWRLPEGELHIPSLLGGTAVFLAGLYFQWGCLRRKREMGAFVIDRDTRQIRKHGVPAGLSFDAVNRLRMTLCISGIFNRAFFPTFPRWLFVHFKDGRQIRIAMGRRAELIPVVEWLKSSGVFDANGR